ncbi:hypothetical protein [Nocardiopsis ansamitocini]|uniref:Uncharacterized protein n=1 Tax=Nocardiopsis ansamitocini TaxID=1670832 RepID=A0A9W6P9D1_9ACTN|nr:hypothetical protein [Nocardiopsis ansamitocini]GLU49434.1 hypothetical protein Nans01_37850 [Nocardiopsis ansamitocini]
MRRTISEILGRKPRPGTVHIVTVGLSLRNTLINDHSPMQPWRNAPGAPERGAKTRAHVDRLIPVENPDPDIQRTLADAHRKRLKHELNGDTAEAKELDADIAVLRPELFLSGASAELASLAHPGSPDTLQLPPHVRAGLHDVVVLIPSDTAVGTRAALWNALALTGGDRSRVDYLASPKDASEPAHGRVLIAPVPGLDLLHGGDLSRAMRHIGTLGSRLIDTLAGPGHRYVFHLTGGYRAPLPYLIGLAEGMRSLRSRNGAEHAEVASVSARMMHESRRERLIPVPLRDLPYALVKEVFREADEHPESFAARGAQNDDLEGYVYQRVNRRFELTPFGEGLRALFTEPAKP